MDNEKFKLLTRRWIALPLVSAAIAGGLFLVVFGALSHQLELVTLGGGALFTQLGGVVGFYFAKKLSEE